MQKGAIFFLDTCNSIAYFSPRMLFSILMQNHEDIQKLLHTRGLYCRREFLYSFVNECLFVHKMRVKFVYCSTAHVIYRFVALYHRSIKLLCFRLFSVYRKRLFFLHFVERSTYYTRYSFYIVMRNCYTE